MITRISLLSCIAAAAAVAQVQNYVPVTQKMLENPAPDDWLMYSRTYDAQRFSPLKQIDKQNVAKLRMVWTRGLGEVGQTETIPIVHNGVMYLVDPGGVVQASTERPAICCGNTSARCPRTSPLSTHQVAGDLRGHHPLHAARQFCRRPRCPHR